MSDMPERLYFAYGSNINLDQMAFRCPAAQVVSPVTLNGYRLLFRGVATIVPDPVAQVKGLLWKLTPECERALDHYEGYPDLYEKQNVSVMDKAGKEYASMVYIMTRSLDRPPQYPYPSYYAGIVRGYEQNGIPRKTLNEAMDHCKREVAEHERLHGSFLRSDMAGKPKSAKKPKGYER